MPSLEKRIAVLEAAQGKHGISSIAEVNAMLDAMWAKHGSTHAEEVSYYGSEHALLKALRGGAESANATPIEPDTRHAKKP